MKIKKSHQVIRQLQAKSWRGEARDLVGMKKVSRDGRGDGLNLGAAAGRCVSSEGERDRGGRVL